MASVSDKFGDDMENEDPLCGLDLYNKEHFYNLNSNVFTEPLGHLNDNISTPSSEFKFYENVTVETISKNRKKYHIPIEDPSKAICPNANCKKEFSSQYMLKSHIRKVHCVEYKYMCEICGRKFTADYLLVRHKMVHDKRTVECAVCGKTLSGRTNMSVHLRTHTDSRPHKCEVCGKTFVRKRCLNLHIKFVHNKGIICNKCGKHWSNYFHFLALARQSAALSSTTPHAYQYLDAEFFVPNLRYAGKRMKLNME